MYKQKVESMYKQKAVDALKEFVIDIENDAKNYVRLILCAEPSFDIDTTVPLSCYLNLDQYALWKIRITNDYGSGVLLNLCYTLQRMCKQYALLIISASLNDKI